MHPPVTLGCDKLAGVLLPAAEDDGGERRHTTMRLALVFLWFGPYSGAPALAVKSVRMATSCRGELVTPYRDSARIAHGDLRLEQHFAKR